MQNPYTSPTSITDEPQRPHRLRRWRLSIVLPVVVFSVTMSASICLYLLGFNHRSSSFSGIWIVDFLIALPYLPGILAAYSFGNLLAHPDDPIHKWNAFLFYSGGVLFWTLSGAFIGCLVDVDRSGRIKGKGEQNK